MPVYSIREYESFYPSSLHHERKSDQAHQGMLVAGSRYHATGRLVSTSMTSHAFAGSTTVYPSKEAPVHRHFQAPYFPFRAKELPGETG